MQYSAAIVIGPIMALDRSTLWGVSLTSLTALSLLVACAAGAPAFPVSSSHTLLGQPLPDMHHGRTLGGGTLEVGEAPVVVKFFAGYCQPCKTTLPAAERVHEEYPDVQFVGVDEDESPETARELARSYGLTFPVVHDEGNVLADRFGVSAMPATFMADAAGIIRWVGAANQTEQELRQAVRASMTAASR